jgi:hypothetical protein
MWEGPERSEVWETGFGGVEILIARGLIVLSKRATRPYIYGTNTYVLI